VVHQVVPHLRLLTLGAPLLVSATNEAVRYRTRKHFALLIRLALEPGRKFARDYLIDLLWPDVPTERGRHSLSQAITMLRQTVGRHNLAALRTNIALAAGVVETDALQLEAGEPEIRGRFLEGFEVRGARGFEEWREGLVAQLHPRIRDCLVKRMDTARRIGDFATVERHAHVLEEVDPLSEDAVRGIMEARAWVGDRSSALKAFTRFAARLTEDLNAKPSPELKRIADLLREGRRATARPTADGVPPRQERRFEAETIIGRQDEFSTLYDAWLEVRQRRSRVIVILGEPGIGKTTLTNAFISSCQMEGGIIARTQAYDAERELPYAVLAELVRQLTLQRAIGAAEPEALAELSRLTPEVVTVFPGVPRPADWPPEVVPLRLADAFFKAVTAATDDFPVVLIVDDIHAADNASVAILHMLARKLADLRVLVIVTGRPGSLRPPSSAHSLVTDAVIEGLGTVELDALSNESAALLVARASVKGIERWGQPPVEHIVRAGGGNPLALELLSREWVSSGGDSLAGKLGELHSLPAGLQSIPRAIRAMVERQTEELAERTRAVFDLASVLGRRMGDLWLYQVIGCSEAEALYHLTQLLEVRLLREVAGNLEFRNELIRAHAYYEVPSTVRLEMHRRIGSMLESRGGSGQTDLEIAWHFVLGRDRSRAIPYALSGAGHSLRAGAAREAELILRHLVREDETQASGRRVHLLLAEALLAQSKADEALPILEQQLGDKALTMAEAAQAAWLYASGLYLVNKNSSARHSELAKRALQVAHECQDSELLAHALFESARAGVETGDQGLTRTIRDRVRHLIASEDGNAPPIAFHANAYCSYFLADIDEAIQLASHAVTAFAHRENIRDLAQAYTGLGNCLIASCRLEEARQAYKSALMLSERMGDDCRSSILMSNLSASYLLEGEAETAIDYGRRSLDIGRRAPAQPALLRTLSNLASAHIVRGEMDKAKECLGYWHNWMKDGRSWVTQVEYLCDFALVELTLGDTSEALELIAVAERESRGKEDLTVTQGRMERLKVLLTYHTFGAYAAELAAATCVNRFRDRHMLAYIEALAALSWVETKTNGVPSDTTRHLLELLDRFRLYGKRALLVVEGFLGSDSASRELRYPS
jgi:DNA-binding SARP family transcriptional activator/tetratricopeptide (TPR) repeat protein